MPMDIAAWHEGKWWILLHNAGRIVYDHVRWLDLQVC